MSEGSWRDEKPQQKEEKKGLFKKLGGFLFGDGDGAETLVSGAVGGLISGKSGKEVIRETGQQVESFGKRAAENNHQIGQQNKWNRARIEQNAEWQEANREQQQLNNEMYRTEESRTNTHRATEQTRFEIRDRVLGEIRSGTSKRDAYAHAYASEYGTQDISYQEFMMDVMGADGSAAAKKMISEKEFNRAKTDAIAGEFAANKKAAEVLIAPEDKAGTARANVVGLTATPTTSSPAVSNTATESKVRQNVLNSVREHQMQHIDRFNSLDNINHAEFMKAQGFDPKSLNEQEFNNLRNEVNKSLKTLYPDVKEKGLNGPKTSAVTNDLDQKLQGVAGLENLKSYASVDAGKTNDPFNTSVPGVGAGQGRGAAQGVAS